jgi:Protein of unknown function (DUF3135)
MSSFPSIDQIIELARTNPEKLESIRKQEIETLINNAPSHMQRRLRGLQFQIDCKRQTHPNPMGACLAISAMMLDSLHRMNNLLHGKDVEIIQTKSEERPSKTVIPFPTSTERRYLNI